MSVCGESESKMEAAEEPRQEIKEEQYDKNEE
jgi:hypothetical protein